MGLVALPAGAQDERSLTLDACIDIGLENSKRLHASLMQVRAAEAGASAADAGRLPTVSLSGSYRRLSDVPPFEVTLPAGDGQTRTISISPVILDTYATRLTLRQPLFTGFRLESGARRARYSAQAVRDEHDRDRSDLVLEIKQAYWSLYEAIELRSVSDENVARVQAHLTDVRNFLDQGITTDDEVLRVEVQLSGARLLQIEATNAVRLASLRLDHLIGLPLETRVQPGTTIGRRVETAVEVAPLIEKALDRRPELRATEHRLRAGEEEVRVAGSERWPQVFLQGDYMYERPNSRILPARDEFEATWDVGVMVEMSVWDWGITGQRQAQARAELSRVRDLRDQLRDAITLEVTQHCLALEEARERIAVAERAVRQAEESQRITSTRFKNGAALNTDLLDADVNLLRARTSYTQALVDYELSWAALARVTGEEAR
jgi:outer membrane protein TolC